MSAFDPFHVVDAICRDNVARLAATLNVAEPSTVPPLWHWTSFLDCTPTAALNHDGHPAKDGLVSTPPYSRRMFAGGKLKWHAELPFDTQISRSAAVGKAVYKNGSSGPLAFLKILMNYAVDGQLILVEEQNIVYRPDLRPATSPRTPSEIASRNPNRMVSPGDAMSDLAPDISAEILFDEMMLFRFSALTFNTHRIHYDFPYANGVEGYPALIVHGPLLAISMLETLRAACRDDAIEEVAFRAVSPAYCGARVSILGWRTGRTVRLEACEGAQKLMLADITLSPRSD